MFGSATTFIGRCVIANVTDRTVPSVLVDAHGGGPGFLEWLAAAGQRLPLEQAAITAAFSPAPPLLPRRLGRRWVAARGGATPSVVGRCSCSTNDGDMDRERHR